MKYQTKNTNGQGKGYYPFADLSNEETTLIPDKPSYDGPAILFLYQDKFGLGVPNTPSTSPDRKGYYDYKDILVLDTRNPTQGELTNDAAFESIRVEDERLAGYENLVPGSVWYKPKVLSSTLELIEPASIYFFSAYIYTVFTDTVSNDFSSYY